MQGQHTAPCCAVLLGASNSAEQNPFVRWFRLNAKFRLVPEALYMVYSNALFTFILLFGLVISENSSVL